MARTPAVQDRELQSALTAAIGTLRRRERTISELHQWLLERGVEEAIAEEAIAELVEIGELDDERFAIAFAQDKRDLARWGTERIESTLHNRGVGRGLAERASREDRDHELHRATELVLSRDEDLGEEAARSRVLAYLTRRGYEYELACDAIRRAGRTQSSAA